MTSFYVLNKQTIDGEEPLYYDDNMKKYINLRFDGYSDNIVTGDYNLTYVDARKCEKEKDFGRNEETRKFFDMWANDYSLICPDIKSNTDFVL